MSLPTIPSLRDLSQAGVHFGHASGKWHPKMAPYIYATRDKLHIINLEKTQEQLEKVLPILEQRAKDGKTIVLIGTKKQVNEKVKEIGERLHIPYVNKRWLGGTMTNWAEMQASIAKMKKLEVFLESEDVTRLTKKERVNLQNELSRMHAKFGGLRDMHRKPEVLFIIDPSYEHNAVKEGRYEGIELIALVDTNSNPSLVDQVIPTNDDGPKALNLIMGLVADAIESGLGQYAAHRAEVEAAKAAEKEKESKEVKSEKTEKEDSEKTEKAEKVEEKEEKPAKKATK